MIWKSRCANPTVRCASLPKYSWAGEDQIAKLTEGQETCTTSLHASPIIEERKLRLILPRKMSKAPSGPLGRVRFLKLPAMGMVASAKPKSVSFAKETPDKLKSMLSRASGGEEAAWKVSRPLRMETCTNSSSVLAPLILMLSNHCSCLAPSMTEPVMRTCGVTRRSTGTPTGNTSCSAVVVVVVVVVVVAVVVVVLVVVVVVEVAVVAVAVVRVAVVVVVVVVVRVVEVSVLTTELGVLTLSTLTEYLSPRLSDNFAVIKDPNDAEDAEVIVLTKVSPEITMPTQEGITILKLKRMVDTPSRRGSPSRSASRRLLSIDNSTWMYSTGTPSKAERNSLNACKAS